jgi:hypothetical protein
VELLLRDVLKFLAKEIFKVMVLFLSYMCINRAINLLKGATVILRARIKKCKSVNANNIEILRVSVQVSALSP